MHNLTADRRAVAALEYALIAGVLGLTLIATLHRFGPTLSTLFGHVSASV